MRQEKLKEIMWLASGDELIIEAPATTIEAAGARLKEVMQDVAKLAFPLKVHLGVGKNWAEAH